MPRISSGARPAPARAKALLVALVAASALALSACESTGSGETAAGGEAARGVETPSGEPGQVVDVISSEEAPAQAPKAPASQDDAAAQADALAAIPPEPGINDDPEQLIGMGPASLNAFLGAPELIRREAPASLWQYRAEDCVLDVVLYPDRTGDKVTYLEARKDGATKIAPRTCLGKLLRARFTGDSG
jgi:hypothetical protein